MTHGSSLAKLKLTLQLDHAAEIEIADDGALWLDMLREIQYIFSGLTDLDLIISLIGPNSKRTSAKKASSWNIFNNTLATVIDTWHSNFHHVTNRTIVLFDSKVRQVKVESSTNDFYWHKDGKVDEWVNVAAKMRMNVGTRYTWEKAANSTEGF